MLNVFDTHNTVSQRR